MPHLIASSLASTVCVRSKQTAQLAVGVLRAGGADFVTRGCALALVSPRVSATVTVCVRVGIASAKMAFCPQTATFKVAPTNVPKMGAAYRGSVSVIQVSMAQTVAFLCAIQPTAAVMGGVTLAAVYATKVSKLQTAPLLKSKLPTHRHRLRPSSHALRIALAAANAWFPGLLQEAVCAKLDGVEQIVVSSCAPKIALAMGSAAKANVLATWDMLDRTARSGDAETTVTVVASVWISSASATEAGPVLIVTIGPAPTTAMDTECAPVALANVSLDLLATDVMSQLARLPRRVWSAPVTVFVPRGSVLALAFTTTETRHGVAMTAALLNAPPTVVVTAHASLAFATVPMGGWEKTA